MIGFDIAGQTCVWLQEQRSRGDVSGWRLNEDYSISLLHTYTKQSGFGWLFFGVVLWRRVLSGQTIDSPV